MFRPEGKSFFVWNMANFITCTRFFAPFIFFVLPVFCKVELEVILASYVVLTITDGLDGIVARRIGNVGGFGKILDMSADKVLHLSGFVYLFISGLFDWIFKFLAVIIVLQELRITLLVIAAINLVAENAFRKRKSARWRERYKFAFYEVVNGFVEKINANRPGRWKMFCYALGVYFLIWNHYWPHAVNYWYSVLCFLVGIYLSFVARRKYSYDFEVWKAKFLSQF